MTRRKTWMIVAAVLALGVFTVLPSSVSAHGGNSRRNFNTYGYNNFNNYGGYGNYGWGGFMQKFNRVWHDTSHWDYHPPTLQRHGDHFHIVPGHYDWHQTGHMHRH